MILSSFSVLLCTFGLTLGSELQSIGKHPRALDYKRSQPSLKIINGTKASVLKYPFIASVEISEAEFGAAVILGEKWLLTTAFLVYWSSVEDLQFRVGSKFYSKQGQVLKASEIFIHPNYTGSWDYDVAVVKTNKPIKMNKKVKPIKLAPKSLTKGTASIVGWGISGPDLAPSSSLLEGSVTVLDWNACSKIYNSSLTSRLLCTADKTVAPCVYDFGDPLVRNPYLYGLYAGGYGCGSYPALYADIPSMAQWINSIINGDQDDGDSVLESW